MRVTDDVAMTATGNFWYGLEVMKLLINHRGYNVTIADKVVKAEAGNYRNSRGVMKLLRDYRGHEVAIVVTYPQAIL